MFIISPFQLFKTSSGAYLSSHGKGIQINNNQLIQLLSALRKQYKLEISSQNLQDLAKEYSFDYPQLENALIHQLGVIKSISSKKFRRIYINSDNSFVAELILQSLSSEYEVSLTAEDFYEFERNSFVLFFRNNYSNRGFETLYNHLGTDVYLVTAGVLHNVLVIDNVYLKNSGLPTHFSNLNAFLACANNDLSLTKNNWLLFYRALLKDSVQELPTLEINACQQGYIAYCLFKFVSQFTNFWKSPTTLDEFNWFWHVDLNSFNLLKEVAVHSPYSSQDMALGKNHAAEKEITI